MTNETTERDFKVFISSTAAVLLYLKDLDNICIIKIFTRMRVSL